MKNIIIAYPVRDTALALRSVLEGSGYHVSHVCALGSSVLGIAQDMHEGVIVCASVLSDMNAQRLAENLPPDFDVLALSKNGKESYMGNLIMLPLPLNRGDFIDTVGILAASKSAFTRRANQDADYIANAKLVIMNSQNMSEMQAHKYLQQESMKTGKKMVDIAKEIIDQFT